MSQNENQMNVLDELSKGACMGRDAIKFILDKVEDESLKTELNNQYREYKKITKKIDKIYPRYSDKEPHKTGPISKIMTWYGIEMKTFLDQSTSKIAELLLKGTNMGIIEGRRILNANPDLDDDVKKLINDFVSYQEESVEKLKKFL